jgi:hypothetical protein
MFRRSVWPLASHLRRRWYVIRNVVWLSPNYTGLYHKIEVLLAVAVRTSNLTWLYSLSVSSLIGYSLDLQNKQGVSFSPRFVSDGCWGGPASHLEVSCGVNQWAKYQRRNIRGSEEANKCILSQTYRSQSLRFVGNRAQWLETGARD